MSYETVAAVFDAGYPLSQFDSDAPIPQMKRLCLWTAVLFAESTTVYAALLSLHYYWV